MTGLYAVPTPAPKPITRQTLANRRAKVVDAWQESGELIQVWRDKWGQLYRGPADTQIHQPAYVSVVEIS
ncbi:MAG: hypothetical protein WBO46_15840 [Caldilineaceae bacterium]